MRKLNLYNVSKEAYRLEIKANKSIVITGSDPSGVFYGMQSLMALLPPDVFYSQQSEPVLPEVIIEDAPRFGLPGNVRLRAFDLAGNGSRVISVK